MDSPPGQLALTVDTPAGFRVVCSEARWHLIVSLNHPVMGNRLGDVEATLRDPDEVRRSLLDATVLLFYRRDERRLVCAVAKRQNGTGFLITCYPTDRIKSGTVVWTR